MDDRRNNIHHGVCKIGRVGRRVEGYRWSSFDPADAARTAYKIVIPTHFDPAIAPPGCQILIVQKLVPVDFDAIPDWTDHKTTAEEVVMQQLRNIFPEIGDRIVVRLIASAMTAYRFTGNFQGAMLGWEMSPDQLGNGRLPVYTPVRNLYLTGHWTQPGRGITPVIISAQRVAQLILSGKDEGRDLTAEYFGFQSAARRAASQGVRR
jgi:phytoene dehydrogenase-like protein